MKFTALQLLLLILTSSVLVAAAFLFLVMEPGQYATKIVPDTDEQTNGAEGSGTSPSAIPDYQYTPIVKTAQNNIAGASSHTAVSSADAGTGININSAELEELTRLPRVGPTTAQRILDYRIEHGVFHTLHELTNIRGIGPKTLERIRMMAYCGPTSSTLPAKSGDVDPISSSGNTDSPSAGIQTITVAPVSAGISDSACGSGKININTAGAEELVSLPRIGPVKAAKIIEYRDTHGRFAGIEDLINVKGIGAKTLDGFRDRICAE